MKINWVISTGFRNWAIHELSKTYSNGLKKYGFESFFSELPLSRRQVRTLRGWLYLPKADIGMLMHQDIGLELFSKGKLKNFKKNVIRYTHHNKELSKYLDLLNFVDLVIVENSRNLEEFKNAGIDKNKILLMPHPIDPAKFYPQNPQNPNRDVILVSNYYSRKRPDLVEELIKSSPDISFTLYGKNWENYPNYSKLISNSNLRMIKFHWEDYPAVLRQHRIFLSLSDIESGPVPLLESLACGLRAVVTDTGTSRDLSSKNTHIIPINPSIEEISKSIRHALLLPFNTETDFSRFTEANQIKYLAKKLNELFMH